MQKSFKTWVNAEVAKELDKERFSSLPLRMRIGIFILIFSFCVGYGVPFLLVMLSSTDRNLSTGLLSGSLVYGFCWVLGVIGLSLAGRDCIKYPIYFLAKLLKLLFPFYFGSDDNHAHK